MMIRPCKAENRTRVHLALKTGTQLPQRRGAGGAVASAAAPTLDIPLDEELADAPALQPDPAQVH